MPTLNKAELQRLGAATLDVVSMALEGLPPSITDQDVADYVALALSTLDPTTATPAQIIAALGGPVAVIPEPSNTSLPTISGTAQEGFTLTATPGVWANSPASVSGVWYRGGTATARIGLTYIQDSADIGATISYVETAISAQTGAAFVANSAPTAAVIAATVAPPVSTVAPVVSGTNTVGSTLTTTTGTFSNSPTSYAYEWQRDGAPIAGATASTYTLATADVGKSIRSRVVATNAGGAVGVASSNAKIAVNALAISGAAPVAQINVPYSFAPTVTGGSGTRTFALTGTVPAGMTFSTATGTISGTSTSAGTTTGLTITVSDPSGSPSAALGPFSIVRSAGGWDIGLARKPAYVPAWTWPASIAAGKSNGSIPADAIEYETGNAGGAFASFGAWIDACNAADKAGAIQTDLTFSSFGGARYLKRGLYGAGASMPKLNYTGRTTGHSKSCTLFVHSEDVVIRGINFVNWPNILGVTYPTVALVKSGALDSAPYHTGTEPTYVAVNSGSTRGITGNGQLFPVRQVGTIAITGSVSISALNGVRQTPAIDTTGTTFGEKFLDVDWYATCETVNIFAGQACTTHAQVRDAINVGSANHGFTASLKADGTVRLSTVDSTVRVFDEINVTKTGAGTVATNNRTPKVSIDHCAFTDCDQGYCGVLDVLELGIVDIHANDCPGTWNLLSGLVTRWEGIRAANNYWRDCMPSRALAIGRATSTLPSGSSLTCRNTLLYLGTDTSVKMRYHGAQGGNIMLIENNEVLNVESTNNSDTVNCAVLADIRNNWQVTANGKIGRFAYNKVVHLIGTGGGDDCNVFYGKPRGITCIGNYFSDFGAAYVANTSTQNGSEAGAMLCKNPGTYNGTVAGIASAGGVDCEDHIFRANTLIDGPDGCCWIKSDENKRPVYVDHNLFDGWVNAKGGVDQTAGNESGLIRVTANQYGPGVNSNRFRRCDPRTSTKRVINFWNLSSVGTVDGARWSVANNEWWNDITAYAADTDLVTYNGSTANNWTANLVTGGDKILSSAGADTGYKWLVRVESGSAFPGNLAAPSVPYGSIDFLQSYGFMG